jgi:hypothetical protein
LVTRPTRLFAGPMSPTKLILADWRRGREAGVVGVEEWRKGQAELIERRSEQVKVDCFVIY